MTFRVNKTKDYTVMSNAHLRDSNLSLKAKGLLSQMLSLPEEWDYSIEGLASINKEKESAITSALNELKKAGYVVVKKIMPGESSTGRIEYEYNIYEQPIEKQGLEKQDLEILGLEIQGLENQGQLNTNNQVQNKKDTEEEVLSKYPPISPRKRFAKPTIEEVKAYCLERRNTVDPEAFMAYYESNGWMVGRKPMKDWKAAVRYWETNRKKPKTQSFEDMARELKEEYGL